MAHLTLRVLGQLQVLIDDIPVSSFESDKVRALLAYLAVEAGRAHRRDTLVGLLWPDCPEQDARRNLSQALYNLRLALGDHTARPPYLLITREAIQFNQESDYSLDLHQFNGYFSAWEKDRGRESVEPSSLFPRLEEMVKLYRGEFLQQFYLEDSAEYEDWILRQRESSHQRVINALIALVNDYELCGDYQAARRYALRQLELDPWREEAHCQVMRLLAMEGQRSAALAQYESCRKALADELGVEPAPKTRDLFEQIRSGTFKPKAEPPAPISSPPIHNLPIPLTPFIGREQELADLARLMPDSECRCITLVGPGGIGKTRLALQAAEQHSREFAQGTAFITLASVASIEGAIPAIAAAIGFAFYGPTNPKVQLLNHLRDKQMLLIVDNVEHLLLEGLQQRTIADLLIEILQAASQVKLLITSREAMNLQEEWIFEVQGLAFPELEQTDGMDEYSAVALFIQRARRAHPGFELNAEDKMGAVRICRLVEGLPLAIELAAAWVRILSSAEIAKEIETNLDFLNAQMRDLPERHRSMRAVFDYSWKLLTEEEQRVLRRLSAFQGGFRHEAAGQVADATLSVLSALVTKSLIRRSGVDRYDLHELIRQFAAEQFAERPEEQTATQARHGRYYLTFFSQADGRLRSSALRETLTELTVEMDNFRTAWDWAIAHHDITRVGQVSATLRYVYELRAWFEEGEAVFHEAAEAIQSHTEQTNPDEALNITHIMRAHSAYFSFRLGKSAESYTVLLSSATTLQSSTDQSAAAYSMWYLGIVCWALGRFTEANDSLRVSLEKARTHGERWYEAAAGEYIGIVMHERGEYEQARPYFMEALAIARKLGDPMLIAHVLAYMSRTTLALGRLTDAETILRESLALSQEIGHSSYMGHALDGLGRLTQMTSPDEARILFAASYGAYKEGSDTRNMARVLSHQGYNSLARGDDIDAQNSFIAVLRLVREGGFLPFALDALAGLASLQAKQGDMEHALELLLLVLNHPASLQETKNRADHLRAELEAQLTSQQLEAAQVRAQARTFEAVSTEILETC